MQTDLLFYILLLIIAFLYASVGHGGASGYLALMSLFTFAPATMRQTALILNIFVSTIAFVQYYRNGYFNRKLFLPFAITSIPAAFIGGFIVLDTGIYKKILAVMLLFSVIRLVGFSKQENQPIRNQNFIGSLCIGAVIGLISGMIGIGGGILLSPIILLLHWADMKQTAAVSSLFILVNSIAGLTGVFSTGINITAEMTTMIIVALIGGLIGATMGSSSLNNVVLKKILAFVLIIASIKLLIT